MAIRLKDVSGRRFRAYFQVLRRPLAADDIGGSQIVIKFSWLSSVGV